MDTLKCAWRELTRRRGRAVMNILGYLTAVAAMLLLIGWLNCATDANRNVLKKIGTHFIVYQPSSERSDPSGRLAQAEGLVAAGVSTIPLPEALLDRVRRIPGVKEASLYLSFRFLDEADGQLITVGGFDPGCCASVFSTTCSPADVVSGEFLTAHDRGRAMVETSFADVRRIKVGDEIAVAGTPLRIKAIVAPATRPGRADIYANIMDVQAAIAAKLGTPVDYRTFSNAILVEAEDAARQDEVTGKVRSSLAGGSAIQVSGFACYAPAAKVMGMNSVAVSFLAVVIAIGAVVVSSKSQWSSVIEREHDIGILKAIGWSNTNIVSQILAESVLQAIIGGLCGCLAAVVIFRIVPGRLLTGVESQGAAGIAPGLLLAAVALSGAGGVVAGVLPALKAGRKHAAEALRHI